jgi:hypothetical protein
MTCGGHEMPSQSLLRRALYHKMPHGEGQRQEAVCTLQHPFDDVVSRAVTLVVAGQSSDVYTEILSVGQMEI